MVRERLREHYEPQRQLRLRTGAPTAKITIVQIVLRTVLMSSGLDLREPCFVPVDLTVRRLEDRPQLTSRSPSRSGRSRNLAALSAWVVSPAAYYSSQRSAMSNPIHVVLLIALVALWVVPAVLVARLAERKRRSFVVYLVASLIIGWLIPLIAALIVPDRRDRAV